MPWPSAPRAAGCPRPGFGISTASTGGGNQVPDDIRFQTL